MPATEKEKGSEANAFGREKCQRIAQYLNASNQSSNSNECTINGRRVVIKCARSGTRSVGVSYQMLKRIDAVLGAFADANGVFEVYWLDVALAQQHMLPRTRTIKATGLTEKGKMGLIQKAVFIDKGQHVQQIPSAAV